MMVGIAKRNGNRKLTIGVSTMAYRKKPCLVVEEGLFLSKKNMKLPTVKKEG